MNERAVDSDSLLIFVHTSNMSSIKRFLTRSAFPVLSRKFLHVRRHIYSVMAASWLTFSSALALNLLAFLLFSYLNSQSYCFNRRFSLNGHRSDTPGNVLESSSTPYLDLCCFCRIHHFEWKSWYTRKKRKRFLRRRIPYSANGTASFNPSILVNILSGDIYPQPGPNFTSNSSSTSTSTNANTDQLSLQHEIKYQDCLSKHPLLEVEGTLYSAEAICCLK